MTDEHLYTFTPEENALYDLQTVLNTYRLRESSEEPERQYRVGCYAGADQRVSR